MNPPDTTRGISCLVHMGLLRGQHAHHACFFVARNPIFQDSVHAVIQQPFRIIFIFDLRKRFHAGRF